MKEKKLLKNKTSGWKLKICQKILSPATERKKSCWKKQNQRLKSKMLPKNLQPSDRMKNNCWKKLKPSNWKLKVAKKNLNPEVERKKYISNLKPSSIYRITFFHWLKANICWTSLNQRLKEKSCRKKTSGWKLKSCQKVAVEKRKEKKIWKKNLKPVIERKTFLKKNLNQAVERKNVAKKT